MKHKITLLMLTLIVLTVLAVTLYYASNKIPTEDQVAKNPKDATYTLDGQPVTLINGESVVPLAPGSASKITTRYFGNEVTHDFDGDGRLDTAFLITQSTGGTGTFYYLVAALNTTRGYIGSHGLLLGDRIAPQTTEMSQDPKTPHVVIVNYAVRKDGESFATPPSIGKSVWALLDLKTLQFGEVVQNFEGEADPNTMKLDMKTWDWITTIYNNDTKVTPRVPKKFTLTFTKDRTFSATTDCNNVGGEYSIAGNKIIFTKMVSTEMFCEGSQEQDFITMLNQSKTFLFTSKGELILEFKLRQRVYAI